MQGQTTRPEWKEWFGIRISRFVNVPSTTMCLLVYRSRRKWPVIKNFWVACLCSLDLWGDNRALVVFLYDCQFELDVLMEESEQLQVEARWIILSQVVCSRLPWSELFLFSFHYLEPSRAYAYTTKPQIIGWLVPDKAETHVETIPANVSPGNFFRQLFPAS